MAFDRKAVLESNNAIAAMEVVNRRGLVVPKVVGVATDVLAKIDELAQAADPSAPTLPTDAAKVEKVLMDAADRRVRATAVRSIAGELRDEAVSNQNDAVLNSGSGWVNGLCDAFAEHLQILREVAPATPRIGASQVSNLSPSEFEAWSRCTNAVLNLEVLTDDRATVARLLTESHMSHWKMRLPLIAAVMPPVGTSDVISHGFRERILIKETMEIKDATTRWFALLELESRGWLRLSLATVSSLGHRVAIINAWPRSFEALSFHGDGGATFEEIVINATRAWNALGESKIIERSIGHGGVTP